MELYVMFVFLALLGLSSAFLMPDILANQTTSVSHSSGHTIESNNQKIEDIMTFLAEEKRLRYQLEHRLEATEKQLELSNRFHDAVTAELQTERQTIQRLEKALNGSSCENNGTLAKEVQTLTMELQTDRETIKSLQQKLDNSSSVIDNLVQEVQTLTINSQAERELNKILGKKLDNASSVIDNLVQEMQTLTKNSHAERELNKILGQKLDNASSVIDRLTHDLQVESNNVNGLEQKLNMTFVEINNLKNDVQDLNTTQQLLESYSNSSSLRNDNMVAFSVNIPDHSYHNPQRFTSQPFNIGGAYNASTGRFTCKQPGVYVFMWTATQSSSGSYMTCCLHINGSNYANACASTGGGTGQHPSGSRSEITHIKTNDQVYLTCSSGSYHFDSGFSGFLLYPEN